MDKPQSQNRPLIFCDWFGRTEAVTVMTKNPTDDTVTDHAQVSSQYGYVTENNITTNLISSLNNTVSGTEGTKTVNYSYTYDSSGKITGITSTSNITGMSASTQYIYDESGQLIKEISGTDYTEYAYDSKGNISTRKAYFNNTLVSTDNFTYGAENWEDRLTGYNSKTIAYDSIGNPTAYLGATLTWRGRELESYTKGNIQILYSYDVDGMRYQKIVKTDGVETARYDYVYSEGKLVLVTYTADGVSDTARFIYDSYGEPRGFILNNTAAYLYVKNAQGDITGIVNENGEVILTCTYDAWGNVNFGSTSMTHLTLAAKLSQINPFTYRGYCYDYDIGMYYLQSRYYDPEIGRFINADSTDYLNATGTVLGCNLFAYCENDPVNGVDPLGYYDPEKASQYAINWARFINPAYVFVRTGDCANFVSQCLLEGGINTTSTWYPSYYELVNNYKYVKIGGRTIRVNSPKLQYVYAYAWNFAKGLYIYFARTKYCDGSAWFNIYSKKSKDITNIVASMAKFVEKGDILFYSDSYKYTGIYHAVIVTEVTKTDVKISAHSRPRKNESLGEFLITKGLISVWALSIRRDAR